MALSSKIVSGPTALRNALICRGFFIYVLDFLSGPSSESVDPNSLTLLQKLKQFTCFLQVSYLGVNCSRPSLNAY